VVGEDERDRVLGEGPTDRRPLVVVLGIDPRSHPREAFLVGGLAVADPPERLQHCPLVGGHRQRDLDVPEIRRFLAPRVRRDPVEQVVCSGGLWIRLVGEADLNEVPAGDAELHRRVEGLDPPREDARDVVHAGRPSPGAKTLPPSSFPIVPESCWR